MDISQTGVLYPLFTKTLVYAMFILLGILVAVGLLFAVSYNKLVGLRNSAEESFKSIDVFLKQRYDLIPNLVNTIKGYTEYESSTLEKVIQARSAAMNAAPADKAEAEGQLAGTLKTIFALAENYPNLKANEQFMQLQTTLTGLEESIQRARRFYNATVRDLNNAVQMFPSNIVAGIFGFRAMDYFDVPEGETQNVKVEF
ncbi:MAG: LemA family protein [Lewinellaceae bacterium]|nr:LemA family protein [Lewinellaceae bacterium]